MEEEYSYYQVAKELGYDFDKLNALSIEQYDKIHALLAMDTDFSSARSEAEESWLKYKDKVKKKG